ncbi:MAG: Putative esterase, partial [uncultured Phycisphaerae bacterium]
VEIPHDRGVRPAVRARRLARGDVQERAARRARGRHALRAAGGGRRARRAARRPPARRVRQPLGVGAQGRRPPDGRAVDRARGDPADGPSNAVGRLVGGRQRLCPTRRGRRPGRHGRWSDPGFRELCRRGGPRGGGGGSFVGGEWVAAVHRGAVDGGLRGTEARREARGPLSRRGRALVDHALLADVPVRRGAPGRLRTPARGRAIRAALDDREPRRPAAAALRLRHGRPADRGQPSTPPRARRARHPPPLRRVPRRPRVAVLGTPPGGHAPVLRRGARRPGKSL